MVKLGTGLPALAPGLQTRFVRLSSHGSHVGLPERLIHIHVHDIILSAKTSGDLVFMMAMLTDELEKT